MTEPSVRAQGSVQATTVLRTGTGGPLITGTQTFFIPESVAPGEIEIAIGFATDELPGPDVFFDSLTLTLQDELAAFAAVFVTLDTTGTFWAPTPGGVVIDPNSIGREAIPFPAMPGVVPANRTAYSLRLPVPAAMTGRQLTLYLDLFDNGNSDSSLGWMSDVTVIPEPAIGALVGLGVVLLFGRSSSKA